MGEALRRHYPEYLMEAAGLGLFMVSACGFGVLLNHPESPALAALPDAFLRQALMGLAMGATAAGLVYSPWGRRSGAHMNPAVTLAFLALGKVQARVAAASHSDTDSASMRGSCSTAAAFCSAASPARSRASPAPSAAAMVSSKI